MARNAGDNTYVYGVGKRKTAIAQVRLYQGEGGILVNGKELNQAVPWPPQQHSVLEPLRVTATQGRYHVVATVVGGGVNSRTDALRHGIARALAKADEGLKGVLREHGMLTRDSREKERKKYGLLGARKAKQSPKR